MKRNDKLKAVNDWRHEESLEKGGDFFRCSRCKGLRFVCAAIKPDSVVRCSRAVQPDSVPFGPWRVSQLPRCSFAARARHWRAMPRAGPGSPQRTTVLDLLTAASRREVPVIVIDSD